MPVFDILGPAHRPGQPIVLVAVEAEAQAFADRVTTLIMGVGKVRAATATTWACLELRPGAILNVGTAGGLRPDEVHPGVVYEVGSVVQHDVNGRAIAALIGTDPSPRLELSSTTTILATGDRFIASPEDRDALALRAHLVDMEGYAVAAVATRLGTPVRLAKTISDDAGHEAAGSWSAALSGASTLLGQWLNEVLRQR